MKKQQKRPKKPFKNRKIIATILFLLTIVTFIAIGARFSWIMVSGEIAGEDLDENVRELYSTSNVLQAERGTIYDRNDNPIAVDATSYKIVAVLTDQWSNNQNPIHIQEPEKVAEVLSDYLTISYENALEKLTSDASQVEFGAAGSDLSYDTASQIEAELEEQNLTGIEFEQSQTRLYPNGTFASHIVGLAQQNNNEDEQSHDGLTGVMGIEEQLDDILRGQNGAFAYQKDSFGYALPNSDTAVENHEDGDDVHLTLDRRLQIHLENIMTEVNEEHSPTAMTATLMHAETGEILASSQRPSFNATSKEGIDNNWQNLLVEYGFEPGSTIKVLTLAAAIEENVFDPNEIFLSGQYESEGGRITDVKPEGWGYISRLEGLIRSSNVNFVQLVEKMGYDTWKNYLDAFGFGQETGISLPNEYSGNNPYGSTLQQANTAFGQGITTTPIQMLQAFSSITNDGYMVQPRIVEGISDSETGEAQNSEVIKKESLISQESAKKALEYLSIGIEADFGTMNEYAIEGYDAAVKTGTSQLVNPETGEYYTSDPNYNYSVMGMLPADDPKLIVYITVQQPTLTADAPYGGAVVQKIYHPLMNRALDYYHSDNNTSRNIEATNDIEYGPTPSFTDMTINEAVSTVEDLGLDIGIVGNGDRVVQQSPPPDTPIYDSQRIILMTNGAMSLPDMTGWSRNDVLKVSELTGINFKFEGEGYVVNQELNPGEFVESGAEVLIELNSADEEETDSVREDTTQSESSNASQETSEVGNTGQEETQINENVP